MKEFWNKRFSESEPVYGLAPNVFLKKELDHLPAGRILLPSEGQGRNAIYAAQLGWTVDAFDYSAVGKEVALRHAAEAGVSINYKVQDINDFMALPDTYDVIGLSYVHVHVRERLRFYEQLTKSLKVGGHVFFEAFSKNQLGRHSGGPKDLELLYSCEELDVVLRNLSTISLEEKEVRLSEGKYHDGLAMVVQYRGIKEATM